MTTIIYRITVLTSLSTALVLTKPKLIEQMFKFNIAVPQGVPDDVSKLVKRGVYSSLLSTLGTILCDAMKKNPQHDGNTTKPILSNQRRKQEYKMQ